MRKQVSEGEIWASEPTSIICCPPYERLPARDGRVRADNVALEA
jgi:hypothetical protein